MRNDEISRTTEQPHLSAVVQSRRLLFPWAHRMPDAAVAKKILTSSPWLEETTGTFRQELKSSNLFLNEAVDMAQNRPIQI